MAETPSEKLFVGDLPGTCDDEQLLSIFSPYGNITSHKLMAPLGTGKRGAIICFSTTDEAKWIVENLNGNIPQGLTEKITVNYKKASKGGEKGGGSGYGDWGKAGGYDYGYGGAGDWGPYGWGGAEDASPSPNLFIGELPGEMDGEQLATVFGAYGEIVSSKLMPPGQYGKRAAILSFKTVSEAKWLVENLNGNIPQGLTEKIKVTYKTSKSQSGGGKGDMGYGGYGEKGYGGKGYDAGPASWGANSVGGKGTGKAQLLIDDVIESGIMPGGTTYDNSQNSLFVGGLPKDCSDKELYQMFAVFGAIAPRGLKAMPGDDGYSLCRGYGFVNFLDPKAASQAMTTLDGTQLPDGTKLKVSQKQQREGKGKGK